MRNDVCKHCGWIPCQCPPPTNVQYNPGSFKAKLADALRGKGLQCARKPQHQQKAA